MGTETIVTIFNHNLVTLFVVKLNNPQMGTETGTPCPLLFQGF